MKRIYLYLVTALVLLVIFYKIWPLPFFAFSKSVLMPTADVLTALAEKTIAPFRVIGDISNLAVENKRLTDENRLLKATLAKEEDSIRNNQLLLAEIQKEKNISSVQAKVIGRTPGGLNATLLLDKGSSDGLKSNAAVLTSGYFVGKLTSVSEHSCEATLIFSHSSLVPINIAGNSEGGLLQGGLEGLAVTDIPISAKVEAGQDITTSGLGGDLPSGLLVGKVGVHLGIEGDLFQKVKVDSPINPYQINYVSVIITK